jgi:hypothetical protein
MHSNTKFKLMNLMFKIILLNLTNFINMALIKNNVNLSTLIRCFDVYIIFNVDLNIYLILIKKVSIKILF